MRKSLCSFLVLLTVVGCADQSGLDLDAVTRNNLGAALMGRFDYAAAVEVLEPLDELAPQWAHGQINLAYALLNRREPGDEAAAAARARAILARDPSALRAHFLLGIFHFNNGDPAAAAQHFGAVVEADESDAYAHYFFAQSLLQEGKDDDAFEHFERARELDPYLRSAVYGSFSSARRLGRQELARERLDEYQRLEKNPRARLAEIAYTKMGPKAMVVPVRPGNPADSSAAPPVRSKASSLGSLSYAPGWALRFEETGQPRWLLYEEAGGTLRVLTADEKLRELPRPFAEVNGVLSAAFGDVNDDGLLDLYLGRAGPNRLFVQNASGWEDQTSSYDVAAGPDRSVDVRWLDADHDGDLDLLIANDDAPSQLLNNNRDGSFRDLGLTHDGTAHSLLAIDFDSDRDLDLLLLGAKQTTRLRNDRLWRYEALDAWPAMDALLARDLDVDGVPDFVGLRSGRLLRLEDGTWDACGETRDASTLHWVDHDLDGEWEIAVVGLAGTQLINPRNCRIEDEFTGEQLLAISDLEDGSWGMLTRSGTELRFRPRPGGVALRFSGRTEPGESMRSNTLGYGTRFVSRADEVWTEALVLDESSAPGQGFAPLYLGYGEHESNDYLEIDWPDGVFQTELAIGRGNQLVTETQRQLASCPVLFVWDGREYRFVSDVLGVGGMGFATGFGQYATPRPWEKMLLPPDIEGEENIRLVLTEPMEEAGYIDQIEVIAYDFPSDLEVALDERGATGDPVPSGEPFWFADSIFPVRAQAGARDVLAHLATVDFNPMPPGEVDARFLGMLASPFSVELYFDRALSGLTDPRLIFDGWVEYGYSQTSFAAWQAGRSYSSMSLDVLAGGRWQPWLPAFGYPAGMPRQSSVPLGLLPEGTTALRLRSQQEIYLDRVAVAVPADIEPVVAVLPLQAARVERVGFPQRTVHAFKRPSYDFADRPPFWDTRYLAGNYTRYGPVGELLESKDGALAIIGPGDGLFAEFSTTGLAPPGRGMTRRFVVSFAGWAKDMDLFTRHGGTLAPVPGEQTAARAKLHPLLQTRFRSGR